MGIAEIVFEIVNVRRTSACKNPGVKGIC